MSGAIRIVSASAGSGKTHRLARELQAALTDPQAPVAPEAVVGVTFTTRAASELAARVRQHLLREGRTEDALRLAAARLGTVHAVCRQLLEEHAFELGQPPEQRVLDEEAEAALLRRTLSRCYGTDEVERLAALAERFADWDWEEDLRRLVREARLNGVEREALAASAHRSRASLLAALPLPSARPADLERELSRALASFERAAGGSEDATKLTRAARERARRARLRLERGGLPWAEWAALAELEVGAKSRDAVAGVREAAARYLEHPGLRDDLGDAIDRLFDLAGRALDGYREVKRAARVVDFTDQLVLALELLSRPVIAERLRGELGLVLVDEFQDTNPLQLALFLELARIAGRSVWVGDQKQAIFGFLGADPALMDAAIGAILGDVEPETLGQSFRSRPELVELTSRLFEIGFAAHGLPPSRVRLEAAVEEPTGPGGEALGPCLERWCLSTRNRGDDVAALASGVVELLADASVLVRDRATGDVRRPRPEDVAILCRSNRTCRAVAAALGARGRRAALPRLGLLSTPEGVTARAALALRADPGDRFAAATLARLVALPADGDEWLDTALAGDPNAFLDLPVARRLRAAHEARPDAGPLEALEEAIETSGLVELCLAWGSADERLANLEALRAEAVAYTAMREAEGDGATPAGLLAWLDELRSADTDERAAFAPEGAVVVSTWHRAKGLEWPVTVLFDLDSELREPCFGLAVEEAEAFDFARPLAGRWLRFWPSPLGKSRKSSALHEAVRMRPEVAVAAAREAREALRLLYVGWTRARDLLVLAGRDGCLTRGLAASLAVDGAPLLGEPEEGRVVWAGLELAIRVRELRAEVGAAAPPQSSDEGWLAAGPREHPPAFVSPSALAGAAGQLRPERLGDPLELAVAVDPVAFGEAVHGFLAADHGGLSREERTAIAAGLLGRWRVSGALGPEDLLRLSDALRTWIARRFSGAIERREWPLARREGGGPLLRGTADLVLETAGEVAVVDHKLLLAPAPLAIERARGFAGQLDAYAAVLERLHPGRPVRRFVHLPLAGTMVELLPGESARIAT